jgi:hypothetical protein
MIKHVQSLYESWIKKRFFEAIFFLAAISTILPSSSWAFVRGLLNLSVLVLGPNYIFQNLAGKNPRREFYSWIDAVLALITFVLSLRMIFMIVCKLALSVG